MKIRIADAGFARYTGHFGVVEFKDGESLHDVAPYEIDRLAASIRITDLGGTPLGAAERIVQAHDDAAPAALRLLTAEEMNLPPEVPSRPETPAQSATSPTFHTKDELSAVADTQGIKGLRVIGDTWGVRGKAIPLLIETILKAQADYKRSRGLTAEGERAVEGGVVAAVDVAIVDATLGVAQTVTLPALPAETGIGGEPLPGELCGAIASPTDSVEG